MSGRSIEVRGNRYQPCPVIVTSASTPLGSPVIITWIMPTFDTVPHVRATLAVPVLPPPDAVITEDVVPAGSPCGHA